MASGPHPGTSPAPPARCRRRVPPGRRPSWPPERSSAVRAVCRRASSGAHGRAPAPDAEAPPRSVASVDDDQRWGAHGHGERLLRAVHLRPAANVERTCDPVEPTPPEEPRELAAPGPKHRWRWIIACFVIGALLIVTVEGFALLSARSERVDGRDALQAARGAALAGDLARARTALDDASSSFASASDGLHGPVGTAARLVPWAGNSADAAAAIADAGTMLSTAAGRLVDGLGRLPDGVGSLAPHDGVVPLGRYAALAGAVRAARDE